MDRSPTPHDTVPAALDAAAPAPPRTPAAFTGEADALWHDLQAVPAQQAPHLGEALVEADILRPQQLYEALRYQAVQSQHLPLGEVLIQLGLVTPAQMRQMLAHWMGVPTVDLSQFEPEPEALARVHALAATREGVLPLMVRDDTLVVAMNDPWDHRLLEMLRFSSELRVRPVLAAPGTLAPALARAYRLRDNATPGSPANGAGPSAAVPTSLFELAEELQRASNEATDAVVDVVSESDNTLVRLVNRLISDAIDLKASDIHIETDEPPRPVRIRMRVDGDLRRHLELPPRVRYALVARLKIMADLDIAEHRRPQDGKLDFARFGGPRMELRMVTVPTSGGLEDVVLRLLGGVKPLPLSGIGLAPANLEALQGLMAKPHGLLLICGPTGCGKCR
jgi:type II secretory ATPase GspE/PulE/Tfp pilus assembly ATPase PilB-like protein